MKYKYWEENLHQHPDRIGHFCRWQSVISERSVFTVPDYNTFALFHNVCNSFRNCRSKLILLFLFRDEHNHTIMIVP